MEELAVSEMLAEEGIQIQFVRKEPGIYRCLNKLVNMYNSCRKTISLNSYCGLTEAFL